MNRREKNLRPVDKFEMRQFREVGMSIKDCASYFNCSVATAHRALAEMREKFGPEKVPTHRRHFARPTLQRSLRDGLSQPNNSEKHG